MIVTITFSVLSLVLLTELITLFFFRHNYKEAKSSASITKWPFVSVLIAARNEEVNLQHCLQSLQKVDYPEDKVEILIGNDQSTDKTQEIINRWESTQRNLKSILILPDQSSLIAKSNVLAQLAHKAAGEYLMILDADVKVTSGWLKSMVAQSAQGFDMVSGYTEVNVNRFFSSIQKMDWQNSIHTLKVFSDLGFTLSALGNNMLVSKTAYSAIGGFEALGPTKVEDLKLTKAISKKGCSSYQLIDAHKTQTQAIESVSEYLLQRKRWLGGVLRYRPLLSIGFVFVRLVLVALIIMSFLITSKIQLLILLALISVKLLIEYLKQRQIADRLDEKSVKFSLVKPFIIAVLDTFALMALVLKPRIEWKKRKY